MHAVPSLQNVFDKSKVIPSRNPSRTLIPSIKNLNLFNKNDLKKVTNGLCPVKKPKENAFPHLWKKM